MATQQIEFEAPSGLTLTAKLYLAGSDTVSYTASAVTEQTNRKAIYRATFSSLASNEYMLIASSGATPVAVWWGSAANTASTFWFGSRNSITSTVNANVVSVNGTNILVGDLNFAVSAGGKMVNDTLYIVPGDKYDADDDTAITFTDSRFPDLDLFTSAELTVYVAGVQVVDHISTLLLDEATKTISVELTEAQTNLLLDYVGEDATFDLELVRADSTRKTVARGPAEVLDPL